MSGEEKKAIEYLKARLYGNEGCELIDVAQSDLRIIIKLVDRVLKDDTNWQKIYDEQEENIREKNNKICEFEFIIEKQQKEIEGLQTKVGTGIEIIKELKEIEKSHQEENGKLRVELEQKKERNKLSDKEKEIIKSYRMLVEETGREDWIICNPKTMWCNYFVSKETIMREIKNIEKRMETATNSTEYQKLHCAQEYLRGLLWRV